MSDNIYLFTYSMCRPIESFAMGREATPVGYIGYADAYVDGDERGLTREFIEETRLAIMEINSGVTSVVIHNIIEIEPTPTAGRRTMPTGTANDVYVNQRGHLQ